MTIKYNYKYKTYFKIKLLKISLNYYNYRIGSKMTTFHNYNSITNLNSRSYSGSQTAKKKIKNFAYSTLDRIGKGYSSIVYKGINETTGKNLVHMQSMSLYFPLFLF